MELETETWAEWKIKIAVYISEVEKALKKQKIPKDEKLYLLNMGQELIFKTPN